MESDDRNSMHFFVMFSAPMTARGVPSFHALDWSEGQKEDDENWNIPPFAHQLANGTVWRGSSMHFLNDLILMRHHRLKMMLELYLRGGPEEAGNKLTVQVLHWCRSGRDWPVGPSCWSNGRLVCVPPIRVFECFRPVAPSLSLVSP